VKTKILGIVLLALNVACSAPGTAQPLPTLAAPSAPPPTASFTRTTAPPTVAPSAPTVRARVVLRDLPGVGRNPYGMALLGDKLYVVNTGTDNLAVIQNDRVVKFLPTGKRPADIVADPAQNRLYVANAGDKTISLVVNDQVALTTSVGAEPRALLLLENRLFVGLDSKGTILVLDPGTLQTQSSITLPNAFSIISLAGDAVHHRIYASLYDKIAVIDSNNLRVLKIIDAKGSYYTLVANPNNDSILAAIYNSTYNAQFLTALDPVAGSTRGQVKIGGDPHGAVLAMDGSRVYVANSYANTVSVVNPRDMTEIAVIPVDLRPYALALDEKARRLYVANYDDDNVNAIDTQSNQVVATIPLGMNVSALVANESAGRVYAASASTDSVFVIEGARVVKEIGVGRNPVDLARDAQGNRILVANTADGTLTLIDESSFSIRATQPITRFMATVAVDNPRARIFAGDVILDANTLAPIGKLTMRGFTLGSVITPDFVRVNPNLNRIYALGSNGTPGSNSRLILYSVDGNTLTQRNTPSCIYGNVSAIALDPETNRVYTAEAHPLAYTYGLCAWDAQDAKIISLPLPTYAPGIEYNPQTHHLFLSQVLRRGSYGPTPTLGNDAVFVLDTNSFGQVARLQVDNPGKMARLGNTIYVANREDGSITLIEDVAMPIPPVPTPTLTPTPYPTLPPMPTLTRAVTPAARVTATPCALAVSPQFAARLTIEPQARLNCPTEAARSVNFVTQSFERGAMFWREDEKRIIVLFGDKTWSAFDDTWNNSLPEDSCPSVGVAGGLTKPRRGFGKVWCEQVNVRAKLGAATAAEFGAYPALAQRFERGQMFAGAQPNQAFVLYVDDKWE